MSTVKEGLLYSESHEWVKVEGGIAVIGVSDFAQAEIRLAYCIKLCSLRKNFLDHNGFRVFLQREMNSRPESLSVLSRALRLPVTSTLRSAGESLP